MAPSADTNSGLVNFRSVLGVAVEDPGSSTSQTTIGLPVSTRPSTRLQHGICKPKIYNDVMIRYGLFTSSGEPQDLQEALSDERWKHAMDLEFGALQKNKTWHLVPLK
jgi:hypothetical protein